MLCCVTEMSAIISFVIFAFLILTLKMFKGHCFTTLADFQSIVFKDKNIFSMSVGMYISYVFIQDITCSVYFFERDTSFNFVQMYDSNTMPNLFTCINCMFADWIRQGLIDFVSRYHEDYQQQVHGLKKTSVFLDGRFDVGIIFKPECIKRKSQQGFYSSLIR